MAREGALQNLAPGSAGGHRSRPKWRARRRPQQHVAAASAAASCIATCGSHGGAVGCVCQGAPARAVRRVNVQEPVVGCVTISPRSEPELESIMTIDIGQVEAIFRYPVKSMAGEQLQAADVGWHGLNGDRRFALRRLDDRTGFPFLTAGRLPDLLLFTPLRRGDGATGEELPTHVRTPDGREIGVFDEELSAEIQRRHGSPVQMMSMKHGIFDEGTVSVITSGTVHEVSNLAGQETDVRRFRPNVLVRSLQPKPFEEDEWLGGVLLFGDGDEGPAISVTLRDVRCSMLNLDPESARPAPEMMKAVVRVNQNNAGVYGTVIRSGRLAVGQTIRLQPAAEKR